MPRQGEEKSESKKHFKGEEIEWREEWGGEGRDLEPRKENACPFDKKWDRSVAWDDRWKLMDLNLDAESVFIPRRKFIPRDNPFL